MSDSFKHLGRRKRLVQQLIDLGISDYLVLDAIRKVERHQFVESAFESAAYENRALPISHGQTISQPFTVAYQSQLLHAKERMKVLEVGTGSGYQAAILCAMGLKVFSIEYHEGLFERSKHLLESLGYSPKLRQGDGALGWPLYQPFDRIIVTAASPQIPPTLKEQLVIGGRLVAPVGGREEQVMQVITRESASLFRTEKLRKFRFVPLLGKEGYR